MNTSGGGGGRGLGEGSCIVRSHVWREGWSQGGNPCMVRSNASWVMVI